MKRNQRTRRLLFCILSGVLLILFLSALFAVHDCHDAHCAICQLHQLWEKTLGGALLLCGLFCLPMLYAAMEDCRTSLSNSSPSLVAQKVKLTS